MTTFIDWVSKALMVIAAILAFFIFKERLGKMQISGIVIIILGVAALTSLTG